MTYNFDAVSQINTTIQIIAMIVCIALLAIRQHRHKLNIQLILVMCAIGCYLASDLYWIVFISMYSYKELPGLSSVELGELGMCLFMFAALKTGASGKCRLSWAKFAVITVFILINAVCWTYWRGSIINSLTSLLGLLPLCIFAADAAENSGMINKRGLRWNYIGFVLLGVMEIVLITTSGVVCVIADIVIYTLLVTGWIAIIVLWIRVVKNSPEKGKLGPEAFVLTVNMVCLASFALYASANIMYCFNDAMTTVVFVLMTVSLMRREYRYDLL